MIEIQIKSRDDMATIAQNPFLYKTALISITDYGWNFAELKNKPEYMLQMIFDDIDADVFEDECGKEPTESERRKIETKYHMMTDEQAKQIAEFYAEIKDKVDVLICQCEHGQSRSAGIAAAIMEYQNKNGIEIFASDKYYPNKIIFRKVLRQLQKDERN